jgi:hypothetical protein
MELASEADTLRFLNGLWYSWGQQIVKIICRGYKLDAEQEEAMINILLRPNDWQVRIKPSLG